MSAKITINGRTLSGSQVTTIRRLCHTEQKFVQRRQDEITEILELMRDPAPTDEREPWEAEADQRLGMVKG